MTNHDRGFGRWFAGRWWILWVFLAVFVIIAVLSFVM